MNPPPPHSAQQTDDPIAREVRSNLLAQPLVPASPAIATAADLALPEPFLQRLVDRVIRASFEERHRSVVEDRPARSVPETTTLLDRERSPDLRAFRPALLPDDTPQDDRFPPPDADLHPAAQHVARRLAIDGLPRTLCDVCDLLRHLPRDPAAAAPILTQLGIPTDLAAWFDIDATPLLDHALAGGRDHARARFTPRPSLPGFHAVNDAGGDPHFLLRVQMTRPDHWHDGVARGAGGPGSGDNFDLLLAIAQALPGIPILASIDAAHADALHTALARTPEIASRVTVLASPLPVSQWAQDNLKPGSSPAGPAFLLPRFASRAEDGPKIDAGDTAALTHVAAHLRDQLGILGAHSPLHFQGGNTMLVRRPDGARLLLLGEGEIARNTALGLTSAQAEEALRTEMGADESIVLPAVGFHLDTEVSVRRVGNELVAFVPDNDAAARIILTAAARTLANAGALGAADARSLRTFVEMRNDERVVQILGSLLAGASDPMGNLAASAAALFRDGPADSPAGNAMRVLTALDFLASLKERPWEHALHPHARAYMASLRRLEADRATLHQLLRHAGLRIAPIPSFSLGSRSASAINMVHLPGVVLLPRRGGFLRPLDDAASRALQHELGPEVRLIGIPSAESERRGGAVHCSVNVFPRP